MTTLPPPPTRRGAGPCVLNNGDDEAAWAVHEHLHLFMDRLRELTKDLSDKDLTDLDREDIHAVTDGSDDAECESLCYFFAHLHAKRTGDFPDTDSGISRESFNNKTGRPT